MDPPRLNQQKNLQNLRSRTAGNRQDTDFTPKGFHPFPALPLPDEMQHIVTLDISTRQRQTLESLFGAESLHFESFGLVLRYGEALRQTTSFEASEIHPARDETPVC